MRRILFALLLVLPFGVGCFETFHDDVREWYVAPGGDDWDEGSYWYPLASISEAMYRARSGDIIFVDPGTYSSGESFPIFVKDGVTIEGDIANKGNKSGDEVFVQGSNGDALFVLGAGSRIRGLKIDNSGGVGVRVTSVTATVDFDTITGCLTDGILVSGTGSSSLNDNVITANGGNGVTVNDSATPVLRGNSITSNSVDGVQANGTSNPNLGDASSNGNNTIQNVLASGQGVGLNNQTTNTIEARGNTWNSASGQATTPGTTVTGPVTGSSGDNYTIIAGGAIQF